MSARKRYDSIVQTKGCGVHEKSSKEAVAREFGVDAYKRYVQVVLGYLYTVAMTVEGGDNCVIISAPKASLKRRISKGHP